MNKTVSLCMIVKNEEKVLARCLESVKNKVDEIIIVDTGSTDSTLNIARQYTNNIYPFQWVDDFSVARNESLKYAQSDYILMLDADEYLEDNADLQVDLISNHDLYTVNIFNEISLGRTFKHIAFRLFRNDPKLRYENRLHEHLTIHNAEYSRDHAKFLIHHVGYTDEKMIEKDKRNRNLPLMVKSVEENPTDYNLYNMGKTYMAADDHEKAVIYFKRAYPLGHGKLFMSELLTKLAYSLGMLKRPEEGLLILQDAVHLYPNDTEMKFMQGRLYHQAGYIRDAIDCFLKCLELGDQGVVVTEGSGGYMAHFLLAELYEQEGRLLESYEESVKVLQLKLNFIPGLKKFLDIGLRANIPSDDIKQSIEQLYRLNSVDAFQFLFNILYTLRHPLLDFYLTKYRINSQTHIEACAKLYSKNYVESREIWNSIAEKEEESGQDLLLLAILLQDEQLFLSSKSLLNLSESEAGILSNFILGRELSTAHLTADLEKMLLDMARQLIILQEFEVFQTLSEFLIKQGEQTQIKLSKILSDYRFDEVAIDLLIKLFDQQPDNEEVVRVLGDLCYRNGYLEDAHLFYTKLLTLNPQYSSYEKNYDLFEKENGLASALKIKQEITRIFPLVNWTKIN